MDTDADPGILIFSLDHFKLMKLSMFSFLKLSMLTFLSNIFLFWEVKKLKAIIYIYIYIWNNGLGK